MRHQFQAISAVTLSTLDMQRAVVFYKSLGLELHRGGPTSQFSKLSVGMQHINLRQTEACNDDSARRVLIIFHVLEVDALYEHVLQLGLLPDFSPRDAEWGERYFHMSDPDGNRLSFAQVI